MKQLNTFTLKKLKVEAQMGDNFSFIRKIDSKANQCLTGIKNDCIEELNNALEKNLGNTLYKIVFKIYSTWLFCDRHFVGALVSDIALIQEIRLAAQTKMSGTFTNRVIESTIQTAKRDAKQIGFIPQELNDIFQEFSEWDMKIKNSIFAGSAYAN
jgi:hypothetical protein